MIQKFGKCTNWQKYAGGGYNIKITVLFQNMLVPQNNILEIPKTVRESSGESVFSEDFFYFTGNCFPVK